MSTETKTDYSTILETVQNWRDAVCLVIDNKLEKHECFSSGEITKILREERPDLCFSHWDVGQYMRDLYFNGSMEYEMEDDGLEPAQQVARTTNGISRTPAGAEVFVYGPNYSDAFCHDFEVEIPNPQADLSQPYDEYGSANGEGPKRFSKANKNPTKATVQGDKRLCIPRSAFDSFMHKTGKNISFGDKVHIKLDRDNMKVNVSLTEDDSTKAYDLTRDRGRVKYKPDNVVNWSAGDTFEIDITDEGLEIDLSEVFSG